MVAAVAEYTNTEKVLYGLAVVVESAQGQWRMVYVERRVHPEVVDPLECYFSGMAYSVYKPYIPAEKIAFH